MFKPHQPHYSQLLESPRPLPYILIEGGSPAANTYFVERIYIHIYINKTTGSFNYRFGGSPAHCVLRKKQDRNLIDKQLFGSTGCSVCGSSSERS